MSGNCRHRASRGDVPARRRQRGGRHASHGCADIPEGRTRRVEVGPRADLPRQRRRDDLRH